jgi:hypothetical protein
MKGEEDIHEMEIHEESAHFLQALQENAIVELFCPFLLLSKFRKTKRNGKTESVAGSSKDKPKGAKERRKRQRGGVNGRMDGMKSCHETRAEDARGEVIPQTDSESGVLGAQLPHNTQMWEVGKGMRVPSEATITKVLATLIVLQKWT